MSKYKITRNTFCSGVKLVKGQIQELSDDVAAAVGEEVAIPYREAEPKKKASKKKETKEEKSEEKSEEASEDSAKE